MSEIQVNTINEYTGANGVTIDGVLVKDNAVNTDTINEKTSAAGVTIDGVLLKDSKIGGTITIPGSTGTMALTSDITGGGITCLLYTSPSPRD